MINTSKFKEAEYAAPECQEILLKLDSNVLANSYLTDENMEGYNIDEDEFVW